MSFWRWHAESAIGVLEKWPQRGREKQLWGSEKTTLSARVVFSVGKNNSGSRKAARVVFSVGKNNSGGRKKQLWFSEKVRQIADTFEKLRFWTKKVSKFVRTFEKMILKVKKLMGFWRSHAESVIGVSKNWPHRHQIKLTTTTQSDLELIILSTQNDQFLNLSDKKRG